MELLIIKSGNDYIRVEAGDYIPCQLDKASVFPMDKLEAVKSHADKLKEKGFIRILICRLKLSEEPFESHDSED